MTEPTEPAGRAENGPRDPAKDHEAEENPLTFVLERLISYGRMEPPLRLITGVAVAQVLVAAVLIAVRDLPQLPRLSVYTTNNELLDMPLLIFWVSVIWLALAITYLLAGALHARWPIRVLGLVLFSLFMLLIATASVSILATASMLVLILGVWAIGIVGLIRDRHHRRAGTEHRSHHRQVRPPTFLVLLLIVLGIYGLAYFSLVGFGGLRLYSTTIALQLGVLTFFLIPVLILAGVDFAEWGDVSGAWLAHLSRRRWPPLLALATGLVAAAILLYSIRVQGPALFGTFALSVGLALVLVAVAWVAGLTRRWPQSVPNRAVAVTVLLLTLTIFGISVAAVATAPQPSPPPDRPKLWTGSLATYDHRQDPEFSIQYPSLWEVKSVPASRPDGFQGVVFDGTQAVALARFYVLWAPADPAADAGQLFTSYLAQCCPNARITAPAAVAEGSWQVTSFAEAGSKPMQGRAWARIEGGHAWLLYGSSQTSVDQLNEPVFAAMLDSWRPAAAARPESTGGAAAGGGFVNRAAATTTVVLLVVAVACAGLLLATRSRPDAGPWRVAALFLVAVAVMLAFEQFDLLTASLFGLPRNRLPHLSLTSLISSAAAGTLLVLGWAIYRRRLQQVRPLLGLLLTLNVGLVVVLWIYDLYSQSSQLRFTVAQATVLLLALTWEITMSGKAITDRAGTWFPAHSRVLLYFGYIMLTAAAILFFSSLRVQSTGSSVEPLFEGEFWPQSGLLVLGAPLLFTLFMLRLARRMARRLDL